MEDQKLSLNKQIKLVTATKVKSLPQLNVTSENEGIPEASIPNRDQLGTPYSLESLSLRQLIKSLLKLYRINICFLKSQ